MTAALTIARRSVWDAIDHWPALDGVFRWKQRFEKIDHSATPVQAYRAAPTAIADLPAIAIAPASVIPSWASNQNKWHPYTLTVQVWTPGRDVTQLEQIWEDIMDALYRCADTSDHDDRWNSYVKNATGHYPQRVDTMRLQFARIGQSNVEATVGTFDVTLKLLFDPFN